MKGQRVTMKQFKLGRIAEVEMSATPMALVGSAVLWLLLFILARIFLTLTMAEAILGSLLAVALHWIGEIVHQLGHAWAARRTGYPMRGIRLGPLAVLAVALYPRDEPELPANIHIRRALGGPAASLLFALVTAVVAFLLRDASEFWRVLSLFYALENLLVFTLGALLPLGFTDGSTLLYWWPRR